MTATTYLTPNRDALAKALAAKRFPPCEHRLNEACSDCLADALIASGAVIDAAALLGRFTHSWDCSAHLPDDASLNDGACDCWRAALAAALTEREATRASCRRCGHDLTGDPSRTPSDDHLVVMQGPLDVAAQPQTAADFGANAVRFAASQDVRLAYCSTIPQEEAP